MTVVAWDGKTLSSDKQVTGASTMSATTKILKLPEGLLGYAGQCSDAAEFIQWFLSGRIPADFPERLRSSEADVTVMFIDLHKKIWMYDKSPCAYVIDRKMAAIGSGEEGALVAMLLGKSSADAVRIVSRINNSCGMGVDSLTLGK